MTTRFDGQGATKNQGAMTRVVCANTLAMASSEKAPVVTTRHNQTFSADRVNKELSQVIANFEAYKSMGEALAQFVMSEQTVVKFFNTMLDIKEDDSELSTRKKNQRDALFQSWLTTAGEVDNRLSGWAALNTVTRFVDHARGGDNDKRDLSANFGSGAQMKQKAADLLVTMMEAA
jgi:hypothetical protein